MRDVTPPTISDCPSSVHIYSDRGSNGTHFTWINPSASDNFDQSVIPIQVAGPMSGSFLSELSSPYTVQYSAVDSSGNRAPLCIFTITVSRKCYIYFVLIRKHSKVYVTKFI